MTIRLQSNCRMSNRQYHMGGAPRWWARIGSGEGATFLRLPHVRGDSLLDVEVDVPDGTVEVVFGVGSQKHGRRCVWHAPERRHTDPHHGLRLAGPPRAEETN